MFCAKLSCVIIFRTQCMPTGLVLTLTNRKREASARERHQKSSTQLLTFTPSESQTREIYFIFTAVTYFNCFLLHMYSSTVSRAGSSRWTPIMMMKVWFTAQCAGKAQQELTHFVSNSLRETFKLFFFKIIFQETTVEPSIYWDSLIWQQRPTVWKQQM